MNTASTLLRPPGDSTQTSRPVYAPVRTPTFPWPDAFVGRSAEMQEVCAAVRLASRTRDGVLITGETGTGRKWVAAAIHRSGDQSHRPFVQVSCENADGGNLEVEIFGNGGCGSKTSGRAFGGRFAEAEGGTLVLKEIAAMPLTIQTRLAYELGRIHSWDGTATESVSGVRVIATTRENLQGLVRQGLFRADLAHLLSRIRIQLSPLRRRWQDIVPLAGHFLAEYAELFGKAEAGLSRAAADLLRTHEWPGNIPELQSTVERALLLADSGTIHVHHLPAHLQSTALPNRVRSGTLKELVGAYEQALITQALKSSACRVPAAARLLGTTDRILRYKMAQHGINPKELP